MLIHRLWIEHNIKMVQNVYICWEHDAPSMHLKILVLNVKTHLEMDAWRFNDFSCSPKTWRRESFREHLNVMASHSLVCIFSAEASESVSVVIKFRQNFFHWMFLTCCYCRGQPAAEQYWPLLHNILIQNTTAPVEWTNFCSHNYKRDKKKRQHREIIRIRYCLPEGRRWIYPSVFVTPLQQRWCQILLQNCI